MKGEATAIEVATAEVGEALCVVRLCAPEAQAQMRQSLTKLGQLTPVQVYREAGKLELIDGFKRLHAARAMSWPKLRAEVQQVDAAGAKVRLWRCNAGAGLTELEEAWLVRALYRDDKLTQPQIGQLLLRHKSWVCRRLMLVESLSDAVTADVRLGLLSASAVRELARLPRGNQDAAAQVAASRGLTSRQTGRLVDALLGAGEPERKKLLETAGAAEVVVRTGGVQQRTPAEQLAADAFAMKRLSVRMHARLLERPLSSLGVAAAALAVRELRELRAALAALFLTLDERLAEKEFDGHPE
jgi:ParB-like chromosome segregation protein Spo0J